MQSAANTARSGEVRRPGIQRMRGLAAVKAALSVLITLTPASGWLIKGTPCQGIRSGVPLSSKRAVRKAGSRVLMLADQAKVRKGGSDVGTEHPLLTGDEEDTGAPPLRPGLEPSLLVSPLHTHKGPRTRAHTCLACCLQPALSRLVRGERLSPQ